MKQLPSHAIKKPGLEHFRFIIAALVNNWFSILVSLIRTGIGRFQQPRTAGMLVCWSPRRWRGMSKTDRSARLSFIKSHTHKHTQLLYLLSLWLFLRDSEGVVYCGLRHLQLYSAISRSCSTVAS